MLTVLMVLAVFLLLQPLMQRTNALLGGMEPWQIVLLAVSATLLAVAAFQVLESPSRPRQLPAMWS